MAGLNYPRNNCLRSIKDSCIVYTYMCGYTLEIGRIESTILNSMILITNSYSATSKILVYGKRKIINGFIRTFFCDL